MYEYKVGPAPGPNQHNCFLFKPKIVKYLNLLYYIADSPNKVYLHVELDLAVISIYWVVVSWSSLVGQIPLRKSGASSEVDIWLISGIQVVFST